MNEKMAMAVNHATTALARARAGLLNPGGFGLDNKRLGAWCEYGFPGDITTADFVSLYRRGGIAHGAVNKLIGHCWKTDPWVIEGEPQDESREETPWEKSFKASIPDDFWNAIMEADLRRLVCRYSALVLRLRDSKNFDQPVSGSPALEEAVPAWAGAIKPGEYDDIGAVKFWQYTPTRHDGTPLPAINVHPDRIIILGDYSADAIGFLEPAYNAFVSLEKVEGGSGEAFLKNAARQVGVNFDREVDLSSLAAMYNVPIAELQEKFNEAAREINRGNDAMLITQGASVSTLVATVPDPGPTYNVNLQTAAAALDIPTKILVGMQTGERASTEDQKYFNARCQSRRLGELSRNIRAIVQHLQRIRVVKPIRVLSVMWDDLTEATTEEKLANAKTMSDINAIALALGAEVFDLNEIRVAAGFEPNDDITPLDEGVDDDEEIDAPPEKA